MYDHNQSPRISVFLTTLNSRLSHRRALDLTLGQPTIQKMFLGADGVSLKRGITTFDGLEAHTHRVMMRHSVEAYVVTDHSKLGRDSVFLIDELTSIAALATDSYPHADFRTMFANAGVSVI